MPTYTAPTATPYRSAAQTDARPTGKWSLRFPLPPESPAQSRAYTFDQQYEMLAANFPPADRNAQSSGAAFGSITFTPPNITSAVASSNAVLVAYTPPSSSMAGMVKFGAQFAVVPESWDDFKTIAYTFPGFPGFVGTADVRNVFTDTVQLRIRHDYYLVDTTSTYGTAATSSGGVVTTSSIDDSGGTDVKRVYSTADIPIVAKSIFVVASGGTPDYTLRTSNIVPAGNKVVGSTTWLETLPTLSQYKALISNASSSGWASLVWTGTSTTTSMGQLVAVESTIQPYAGNIIERITQYVLAK